VNDLDRAVVISLPVVTPALPQYFLLMGDCLECTASFGRRRYISSVNCRLHRVFIRSFSVT